MFDINNLWVTPAKDKVCLDNFVAIAQTSMAWNTSRRDQRSPADIYMHEICLHLFLFTFLVPTVAAPPCPLSSSTCLGSGLVKRTWGLAAEAKQELQKTSHLGLFMFCQRKLQSTRDHMFLFYPWPNHGKKLAFWLRDDLALGCNSKCLYFSLCVSKAVALCL